MIYSGQTVRIRPNLRIFKGMPALASFLCVFFILLIFFMMGTNFVPVQGVRVELPHAASELTYASKDLIVTVDSQMRIYFDDMPVAADSLKRRISDTLSVRGRSGARREQLVVRADVNTPLPSLATIFSIARELDMNVVLMTAPEDTPQKAVITESDAQ